MRMHNAASIPTGCKNGNRCTQYYIQISYIATTAKSNVGLYRDDGLATSTKTPRQTENIKKEITKIFRQNNLKITIEANKTHVDFLDITMDLTDGQHKPFMKPNNTPLYVHKDSNHPPSIIRNIPESINKRLSAISSNETVFNQSIAPYQEALKNSNYSIELKYKTAQQNDNNSNNSNTTRKRNRTRKITWFNPPFSKNVATNIGQKFLKLLDTCFPPNHQLHKLLNRNTIKISYSCMPNLKQIIDRHNKTTMDKTDNNSDVDNCNCRDKTLCPLNKQCLTSGLIYQATVTRQDNNRQETYIGLTDNTFKTRYNGHNCTFRHNSKRNTTTLSQYIWTLKDKDIQYDITWKTITKGQSYNPTTNRCNLCLKEKYFIICKPHLSTLNNRNELASTCRHRKRHLLCNS
jgi:hypothetical protein